MSNVMHKHGDHISMALLRFDSDPHAYLGRVSISDSLYHSGDQWAEPRAMREHVTT